VEVGHMGERTNHARDGSSPACRARVGRVTRERIRADTDSSPPRHRPCTRGQ
jgi:hypothetical protein